MKVTKTVKVPARIRVGNVDDGTGSGKAVNALKILSPDLDAAFKRAAKNWEKKNWNESK